MPWGIHRISSIYGHGTQAGLPDGRWVKAVAEPYSSNWIERLRAAWWVLTGKAEAFVWPKPGELEDAMRQPIQIVGVTPADRERLRQIGATP